MCLAIPGKVVTIQGHKAIIQYPKETRQVLVGDDPIKPGDYVMVQMGVVIKILSKKEAAVAQKAWE
jgi:hydrogenase expression/formation protein HypC